MRTEHPSLFYFFTKLNWQIVVRACAALSLMCLLTSCAMLPKEKIANSTTDYNLVVEKAQNEMLLLNIVRASKRHPMYFTDLNLLRGNMSYGFQTGSITIPFGQIGTGLNGAYSIAPSISLSNNPSFDLAILDNQEFIYGIMTPVPMETVEYYWQQGWPKEMLLHLFIERIEETDDKGIIKNVFDNYPEDTKKFEDFQKKLQDFKKCKLIAQKRDEAIGPKINTSAAQNLQFLIEVQKAGLTLKPDGNEYQLTSSTTDYVFKCDGKIITDKIYRRSPEAILYYLGEILRAETRTEKAYTPKIEVCESKPPVPLFLVRKSTDNDETPSVAVDYEGIKYVIPRNLITDSDNGCLADRSMHALSLISQLIGLQKKREKMPVTGVVNVIGR